MQDTAGKVKEKTVFGLTLVKPKVFVPSSREKTRSISINF